MDEAIGIGRLLDITSNDEVEHSPSTSSTTMSRRQSRVSTDARQNDTLLEFENYKKKFLLANKHITKLNSSLSVRVEELNAQISTLYVENLRLRASEIALVAQLKKEREKSRRVMSDAEAAVHNFMKHLGYIRKSHNIPHGRPSSPESQPHLPRARRPVPNPDASPPPNRLARPPNFPNIHEDDEGNGSSPESPGLDHDDDERDAASPTPVLRKSKPRSSGSKLPLPTRAPSPPPLPAVGAPVINFDQELTKAGKRKPTRRQSGLLTTSMSITTVTEVPRAPSPVFGGPLHRELALEEEEEEVMAVIAGVDGQDDEEPELIAQSILRKEKKKRTREKEKEVIGAESESRSSGESVKREKERRRIRDIEEQPAPAAEGSKKSKLKDVTNSPPVLSPLDTALSDRDRRSTPDTADQPSSATSTMTTSSIMTSRTFLTTPSTTPAPSLKSEPQYLPTPRSSSPIPPTDASDSEQQAATGGRERRARRSVNYAEPKLNTKMRKPDGYVSSIKRQSVSNADGPSAPRTSGEYAAPDQPQPLDDPQLGGTVKRKKSRAYVLPEDGEESEGAQADAEYAGSRAGSGGWVNTEGRRRSVQTSGNRLKMLEGDDGRRHSMAV
ncbi:hypothetical protein BXZ70DRAFT_939200 [Cristinia sonorae]|uniref:Shugoshin C-terminal domain-containing protein n=1 Tax=Cristinia sonorae TaxID=1940300 RepID=A0A8K0UN24_9AGAR|nr:hypothetical protein BXZ70DRAFT_939200 [Cristinia sonorae]